MASDGPIMYFLSRVRGVNGHYRPCYIPFDEDWVDIQHEHVSEWDFTKQNLENAYAHILRLHVYTPQDEAWYGGMEDTLPDVIECTARLWLPRAEVAKLANVAVEKIESSDNSYAGLKLLTLEKEISLLMRQDRQGWDTTEIFKPQSKNRDMAINPLREIATLCIEAGTRYGAIFVGNGIVATCVYYTDDEDDARKIGIRFKMIPCGPGQSMTHDFVIWCLAMMALNEDHRSIKPLRETLSLGVWLKCGGPRKRDMYLEHPVSRRRFRNESDIPGATIQ